MMRTVYISELFEQYPEAMEVIWPLLRVQWSEYGGSDYYFLLSENTGAKKPYYIPIRLVKYLFQSLGIWLSEVTYTSRSKKKPHIAWKGRLYIPGQRAKHTYRQEYVEYVWPDLFELAVKTYQQQFVQKSNQLSLLEINPQ